MKYLSVFFSTTTSVFVIMSFFPSNSSSTTSSIWVSILLLFLLWNECLEIAKHLFRIRVIQSVRLASLKYSIKDATTSEITYE